METVPSGEFEIQMCEKAITPPPPQSVSLPMVVRGRGRVRPRGPAGGHGRLPSAFVEATWCTVALLPPGRRGAGDQAVVRALQSGPADPELLARAGRGGRHLAVAPGERRRRGGGEGRSSAWSRRPSWCCRRRRRAAGWGRARREAVSGGIPGWYSRPGGNTQSFQEQIPAPWPGANARGLLASCHGDDHDADGAPVLCRTRCLLVGHSCRGRLSFRNRSGGRTRPTPNSGLLTLSRPGPARLSFGRSAWTSIAEQTTTPPTRTWPEDRAASPIPARTRGHGLVLRSSPGVSATSSSVAAQNDRTRREQPASPTPAARAWLMRSEDPAVGRAHRARASPRHRPPRGSLPATSGRTSSPSWLRSRTTTPRRSPPTAPRSPGMIQWRRKKRTGALGHPSRWNIELASLAGEGPAHSSPRSP